MAFVIGLLTVVMVLDCLFLILLVLMQLPKKEAGAGLAFGGAATDALFGAGSGNFLTKATKYAAIAFFVLTVVLAVMQNQYYHRHGSEFRKLIDKPATAAVPAGEPAPSSAAAATPNTNITLLPPAAGTPASGTNSAK
ncbi:MAG TPA: preprotein translocase subunit SecG [Candidatus Paceibacterota bacterium]|nr:preprotein translocase subunit SecG [Candidatus Paceibacterota bacterium]